MPHKMLLIISLILLLSSCDNNNNTTVKNESNVTDSASIQPQIISKKEISILGVWSLYNDEAVSFEIQTDSIYYFDTDVKYQYTTKGDSITIDYGTWMFSGKFTLNDNTLIIQDSINRNKYIRGS